MQFGLVADATLVGGCDTLIYFWPKNKPEALFQMTNLLSLMPLGCNVFVVGENHSAGLDNGSQLLLEQPIQGHVADIGCGAGVLSAVLAKGVAGCGAVDAQ